ncbi:DeoR/GlpR family DNA-binding transcription regulator [uncultured Faecalibaculum sp.]|uniref:DeoR/GlpR family DNA-binding transcription regulator n=2 Tax=uncultured Faecalibaculum sp. TaxID=1729681 RepID=UPI0025E993B8|nr:DeoR/GlpR family DNA-binding transcription regulator [uncultured Faecalibaculum sp.]
MMASERFSRIAELVNEKDFVSTRDLSEQMKVSEPTIRKDLEELDRRGILLKVHGGARRLRQQMILTKGAELDMSQRSRNQRQKDAVARKAASIVQDGDCVFLDGGTSVEQMMPYLQGKKIRIVTHSLLIAQQFADPGSELFALGGRYIPEYKMFVGPMTEQDLAKFNFDHAFIGCAGIDLAGKTAYTAELDTMAIKQKAMDKAQKKYLLADSSKLSIKGFCSFTDTDAFDAVFCDDGAQLGPDMIPDNCILVHLPPQEA